MPADLKLLADADARMRNTLQMATSQEVNHSVPINRYYRSLNELFRVAGVNENDPEKAFIYYMRFVSLAVEELPKHKEYEGFLSVEKTKAEISLAEAFRKAESLKMKLKKSYEEQSIWAKRELEKLAKTKPLFVKSETTPNQVASAKASDSINDGKMITGPGSNDISNALNRITQNEVVVLGDLVEKFVLLAQSNTDRDIETCGILCGQPVNSGIYRITHTVIPKQIGGRDSCDTHNEEEVFAYQDAHNLITLGWIHTHPSQTAFLSSVDLHTHCSYQLMLPEAVAIVIAPKHNEVGIFRLTEPGMSEISKCRQTGFHLHENAKSLFYYCHDVRFQSASEATVIDLR